jgi:hypothetical protein
MGEINFKFWGKAFIASFLLVWCIVFLSTRDSKRDDAKYTIVSGNEKTYYAQTFRMVGRGIMFDDVYGKKVILMGNIDIQYKNNEL